MGGLGIPDEQVRFLIAPEQIASLHGEDLRADEVRSTMEVVRSMMPGFPIVAAGGGRVRRFNFHAAVDNTSPVEIWDASVVPSTLRRTRTTGASPIPEVNTCFAGLSHADLAARRILGVYPVNTPTHTIAAEIRHPGRRYNDNAIWLPLQKKIIYGNTNPRYYKKGFHEFHDVSAHELGHSVNELACGLVYRGQSGSIDESLADVFAIAAKQYTRYHTHRAAGQPGEGAEDWLIAPGLMNNDTARGALRAFDNPGSAYRIVIGGREKIRDPQVSHMRDYRYTTADNGGVHTNSGIPSHAFYLATTNSGYLSYGKPARLWFRALEISEPSVQFDVFAANTIRSAHELFPANGHMANIVARSWDQVGVDYKEGLLQTSDKICALGLTALFGLGAFFGTLTYYNEPDFRRDSVDAIATRARRAGAQVVGGTVVAGTTTWFISKRHFANRRLRALGVNDR